MLAAALEFHRDDGATLDATVLRSHVIDAPTALVLTSGWGAGAMHVHVESSVFETSVSELPVELRPRAGRVMHIALHHASESSIDFVSNTVVGVARSVLSLLPQAGDPLSIRMDGNLFWGDEERPLGGFVEAGREPAEISAKVELLRSRVPSMDWIDEAALNVEHSALLQFDPAFVDAAAGDYRLRSGSQLIDAGAAEGLRASLDFRGACRRVGQLAEGPFPADVGAFEVIEGRYCDSGLFRRGDCDLDGAPGLTDAITMFSFLFLGSGSPECHKACDTNDSGTLDLSDGIALLLFLFNGGLPPTAPFDEPGFDPSADLLRPGCPAS